MRIGSTILILYGSAHDRRRYCCPTVCTGSWLIVDSGQVKIETSSARSCFDSRENSPGHLRERPAVYFSVINFHAIARSSPPSTRARCDAAAVSGEFGSEPWRDGIECAHGERRRGGSDWRANDTAAGSAA